MCQRRCRLGNGSGSGARRPGAPPPAPPRARGPELALAVEAAQTAIAVCLANGYKTTATVVDSAGVPVAILSGDGGVISSIFSQRAPPCSLLCHLRSSPAGWEAFKDGKEGSFFFNTIPVHRAVGDGRMSAGRRQPHCEAGDGKTGGEIDAAGEAEFDDGAIVGIELDVRGSGERLDELAVGDEVGIEAFDVDGAPRWRVSARCGKAPGECGR